VDCLSLEAVGIAAGSNRSPGSFILSYLCVFLILEESFEVASSLKFQDLTFFLRCLNKVTPQSASISLRIFWSLQQSL
jgi:hypothetical protein